MANPKSHGYAAPFAIRAVGRGFALSIRQFFDARSARRLHRRAERELNALPPELQRDVGWTGRRSYDGN